MQGHLPLSGMTRIAQSLLSTEGLVEVDLHFGRDEEKIRYVKGHLETTLVLQCQRCMEPYNYAIIADFASGIVGSVKDADRLPKRYDPIMSEDGNLNLSEMVEDELIISLPIVPLHKQNECKVRIKQDFSSKEIKEVPKDNPFKVIELLRSQRDKK